MLTMLKYNVNIKIMKLSQRLNVAIGPHVFQP